MLIPGNDCRRRQSEDTEPASGDAPHPMAMVGVGRRAATSLRREIT